MKRGKAPPIGEIRLTKGKRLYNLVFKERNKPTPDSHQMDWLEENCLRCADRNVELMVTGALDGGFSGWKHICIHRGPTRRLTYPGERDHRDFTLHRLRDCSGFTEEKLPENFP